MRFGEKKSWLLAQKLKGGGAGALHSFPWNFLDYFPLFELSLPLTPPFEFLL